MKYFVILIFFKHIAQKPGIFKDIAQNTEVYCPKIVHLIQSGGLQPTQPPRLVRLWFRIRNLWTRLVIHSTILISSCWIQLLLGNFNKEDVLKNGLDTSIDEHITPFSRPL
jgi:hypothetical protein